MPRFRVVGHATQVITGRKGQRIVPVTKTLTELDEFYNQFGPRLPQPIADSLATTRRRFGG